MATTPIPLSGLSDKQLDELADQIPYVKAWLKAVEGMLMSRINNGADLTNVSVVPTNPRRYWTLEGQDLIIRLRKFSKLDVVAPRVPLSPAQAEKTLGKKLFGAKLAEFVVRRSSGTKLAYLHDETEEDSE